MLTGSIHHTFLFFMINNLLAFSLSKIYPCINILSNVIFFSNHIVLKGAFSPSPLGHAWCRWVLHQDRFGEIQHYISCSQMDPLQWRGAARMRVQTADKNITIIHTTPVHQLRSNIVFSSEKLISFASGDKYAPIELQKTVQSSSKQICRRILSWDGLFHWRKRYYGSLARSSGLHFKHLDEFVYH